MTPSPDDLAARLARCQRALDASQDGYWERDLRSQQIWYSPSFLSLFGFAEGELSGERGAATSRVHPDDRVQFRTAYDEAMRNDGRFDYEVRFLDASGQWRWVRGRGRAWFGANGQAEILCGSVADVHHRTTALNDLQRHRRTLEAQVQERTAGLQAALVLAEQRRLEAERANAAKSRFLAQMSHEIRTPLNGVMGLTELALRAAHSPEQRRHLEAARQSGQALLQVINDVLDFSRIESGHLALPSRPFDPAALLTETFRAVMPLARERKLAMMFDWFGDDEPLLGDESGLRQIVTNLLGNAIKFTEIGHVAMVVEVAPTAQARRQLTIRVTDTGPGVPVEHRRRVFEAFEQADDQLARRHGGTGLGLTIASRLTQAMGGSLRLDCPPEGGSVFSVDLTLDAAPVAVSAAAKPGASEPSAPISPGGRAWVVYHRSDAGEWMARRLRRVGWQTEVMIGLPGALARAAQGGGPLPDLVLLGEPMLDAQTDLSPLRQALPRAEMHLVIRSDWCQPVLERQAGELRISPLVAPLTPATLRSLGRSAVGDTAAPSAAVPDSVIPVDADVLLVEDNPINQLVGQAFLKALGMRVRLAADGHEALAACAAQTPDLVLMDLQMPGMDGLEATRQLRQRQQAGQWPGAPIVALTAHASEADRAACLAAGMNAVLTKPLTLEMLREQLQRWLPAQRPVNG